MNRTESIPPANGQAPGNVAIPASAITAPAEELAMAPAPPRRAGYGMPCAKCRTYYSADMDACPVCKSAERVSPAITGLPVAPPITEPLPDPAAVEEERERFLRDFKAQAYPATIQVNASESFRCGNEQNHPGSFEPAVVCQNCYDQIRQQADLLEAALHMDVRDATQIIYDAVWSDPSDPGKTYQNAAHALLNELRRRAGIPSVIGPMQGTTH